MPIATVSSKGQITLPAASRRALGIKSHDRVLVAVHDGRIVIEPVGSLLELRGFLGKGLPPDEERRRMAEGVARHVMGKE